MVDPDTPRDPINKRPNNVFGLKPRVQGEALEALADRVPAIQNPNWRRTAFNVVLDATEGILDTSQARVLKALSSSIATLKKKNDDCGASDKALLYVRFTDASLNRVDDLCPLNVVDTPLETGAVVASSSVATAPPVPSAYPGASAPFVMKSNVDRRNLTSFRNSGLYGTWLQANLDQPRQFATELLDEANRVAAQTTGDGTNPNMRPFDPKLHIWRTTDRQERRTRATR